MRYRDREDTGCFCVGCHVAPTPFELKSFIEAPETMKDFIVFWVNTDLNGVVVPVELRLMAYLDELLRTFEVKSICWAGSVIGAVLRLVMVTSLLARKASISSLLWPRTP